MVAVLELGIQEKIETNLGICWKIGETLERLGMVWWKQAHFSTLEDLEKHNQLIIIVKVIVIKR